MKHICNVLCYNLNVASAKDVYEMFFIGLSFLLFPTSQVISPETWLTLLIKKFYVSRQLINDPETSTLTFIGVWPQKKEMGGGWVTYDPDESEFQCPRILFLLGTHGYGSLNIFLRL